MDNIFENAKFGDKFLTRDGRKAIYHKSEVHENEKWHFLIVESAETIFMDKPLIYAPYSKYVNKNGLGYPENLKAYNLEDASSPNYCNVIVSEWQEPIVCRCEWENYYDYRIMMPNGEGHVRVSFFQEETIISDLFVAEEHRHKGYASILLDKVDGLLNGKTAIIYPLEEWQKEWYDKRGYIIGKDNY